MCVICGDSGYRVGHICSMRNEAVVCEECCSKCEYRKDYRCMHKSESLRTEEDIKRLGARISFLEIKAFHYFEKGWVKTGDNLLYKAKDLRIKKRGLEEELYENREQNIQEDGERTTRNS